MSAGSVQAVAQVRAVASAAETQNASKLQATKTSSLPQDTVTISAAAKAQASATKPASAGDKDHD